MVPPHMCIIIACKVSFQSSSFQSSGKNNISIQNWMLVRQPLMKWFWNHFKNFEIKCQWVNEIFLKKKMSSQIVSYWYIML